MSQGKPPIPFKVRPPKADPDRRLSLDPKNIGSAANAGPGIEFTFDADKAILAEATPANNFKALLEEMKGKDAASADKLFEKFGSTLMKKVAEVGEKYKDRSWEMVDICSQQTGISFPHKLQVLIELFALVSRPIDKWAPVESHPQKMRFQQYSCSYYKELDSAGKIGDNLPCRNLCLGAFNCAAKLRNIGVQIGLTKEMNKDHMCEFTFNPRT
ncbi:MAG: hypothetical protein HY730_06735 [Candidatus Tectomicrobia bacterium]|uniref:Uncharacterized protein n=1 Tax=Tectimicrobiota bacterium TaxID=2528274 RepID=A0A933GLG3_UNCTE|nr:hypothetical protein [Candidatus Tectomicrobia bacterium]